jgi:hypothetical protein
MSKIGSEADGGIGRSCAQPARAGRGGEGGAMADAAFPGAAAFVGLAIP